MAYTNVYEGIVFVEGVHPTAKLGQEIKVDLSFRLGAQLKSLRDVKECMCKQAKRYGFNAVVDFTYGQKSRWLAIDDVAFWGKGTLATIPKEEYDEICARK